MRPRMTEMISLAEEFEELPNYEDFVKDQIREVRNILPFFFLATKKSEAGNSYIFRINYRAYPLYACIDEQTRRATITRTKPKLEGYTSYEAASEDDIVFPYMDHYHTISKLLLLIVCSKYLWVPLLGASEYSRKVVDLDRKTFEKRVREVLSKGKE